MANLISAAFDPQSLGTLAKLAGAETAIANSMGPALDEVGKLLVSASEANTWIAFQNPTGKLAGSIGWTQVSTMEGVVIVDVPYAWRLEAGFHGADSLGRVYDQDAEPYVEPAMEANSDEIMMIMHGAVADAFATMGVQM